MPAIVMNLKGYPNHTISISGIIKNNGISIPASLGKSGYYFVNLTNGDKTITKRVDKLVAKAFVFNPKPHKITEVIHLDGNRQNNLYTNLLHTTENEYNKWQEHLKNKAKKKSTKPSKSVTVFDTYSKKTSKFDSPKLAADALGLTPQKVRKALRDKLILNNLKFSYS